MCPRRRRLQSHVYYQFLDSLDIHVWATRVLLQSRSLLQKQEMADWLSSVTRQQQRRSTDDFKERPAEIIIVDHTLNPYSLLEDLPLFLSHCNL